MKKNRIISFIVIAIICVPLILLTLSYINYKINNIENSCSSEVERYIEDIRNQDGSIFLNEYLEFKCDGFYIIDSYATCEYKHEIVDKVWYDYSSYASYLFNEILFDGDTTDEIFQQLVFVKNNKIVSVATIYRKDGDFTSLKEKYYDIDQLFTNVSSDYNWNYIVDDIE